MSGPQVDLGPRLERLNQMSRAELRAEWSRASSRPAPRLSPRLLRLAVAYELQAKASGRLSRHSSRKLARLAAGEPRGRTISAGMRLVREWAGKVHVVTIGEDKVIRWNDKEWGSLSEVARAITGTRWSGPLFFGLRGKGAAA